MCSRWQSKNQRVESALAWTPEALFSFSKSIPLGKNPQRDYKVLGLGVKQFGLVGFTDPMDY